MVVASSEKGLLNRTTQRTAGKTREGCSSSPPPPCRDFLGTVHLNSQQTFAAGSAYFEKNFLSLGEPADPRPRVPGHCLRIGPFRPCKGRVGVATGEASRLNGPDSGAG